MKTVLYYTDLISIRNARRQPKAGRLSKNFIEPGSGGGIARVNETRFVKTAMSNANSEGSQPSIVFNWDGLDTEL